MSINQEALSIGTLMVFSAYHFLVKRSQSVMWKLYPLILMFPPTIKSSGENIWLSFSGFLYWFLSRNFPSLMPK